jgi:hypothetical protein
MVENGYLICVENVNIFIERLEVRKVVQQRQLWKRGKNQYKTGENCIMTSFMISAAHLKSLSMNSSKKEWDEYGMLHVRGKGNKHEVLTGKVKRNETTWKAHVWTEVYY